ncbi:hypothetical protein CMV_003183 [Castanea mollissima]|uniref:Uncharacterized protein n=1 Tax=Castanea mollissima TaxID=60419 RepID=A0A8J4S0P5_9ROSI|nr:hypothetical protein CMV_003183 [Castanea mollissima]
MNKKRGLRVVRVVAPEVSNTKEKVKQNEESGNEVVVAALLQMRGSFCPIPMHKLMNMNPTRLPMSSRAQLDPPPCTESPCHSMPLEVGTNVNWDNIVDCGELSRLGGYDKVTSCKLCQQVGVFQTPKKASSQLRLTSSRLLEQLINFQAVPDTVNERVSSFSMSYYTSSSGGATSSHFINNFTDKLLHLKIGSWTQG